MRQWDFLTFIAEQAKRYLWTRLSRRPTDPGQTLGRVDAGRIFVMLNREDYCQCAYVIPKGGFDQIRQGGLTAFRAEITRLAPYRGDRVGELDDWSDIKLLTVAVDRLRVWHRPGLLCIRDAAHAMSPIGGVGINLAIRDAVAAANLLDRRYMLLAMLSSPIRRKTTARLILIAYRTELGRHRLDHVRSRRPEGQVGWNTSNAEQKRRPAELGKELSDLDTDPRRQYRLYFHRGTTNPCSRSSTRSFPRIMTAAIRTRPD
jgi:2-polyprenyl-6-methoxyphenol hydroxylase-like FAD-dependent oxidoreductase